jgi:hypothetical protein
MTARVLFVAAMLLACASASAQTDEKDKSAPGSAIVNKCIAADGSVMFSDQPCPDSHKAQKVDTTGALRTGSGGHTEEIAGSVADSNCRRNAQQSSSGTTDKDIETSNSHIAQEEKDKARLAGRKIRVQDGSGNLIDDPAAQQKIAELDAAIAKEREFQQKVQTVVADTYQSAVKNCDEAAKKNAKAQEKQ